MNITSSITSVNIRTHVRTPVTWHTIPGTSQTHTRRTANYPPGTPHNTPGTPHKPPGTPQNPPGTPQTHALYFLSLCRLTIPDPPWSVLGGHDGLARAASRLAGSQRSLLVEISAAPMHVRSMDRLSFFFSNAPPSCCAAPCCWCRWQLRTYAASLAHAAAFTISAAPCSSTLISVKLAESHWPSAADWDAFSEQANRNRHHHSCHHHATPRYCLIQ